MGAEYPQGVRSFIHYIRIFFHPLYGYNKIFNFGYLLKNSRSESLRPIKGYLLRHSLFVNNMNKIGEQVYGVSNILDNDKQAIQARISYVFTREPRFIGLDAVLGSNSPP